MSTSRPHSRNSLALWLTGPLLGLALLVLNGLRAANEFELFARSNKVTASVGFSTEWGNVLPLRIVAYAAAVISVHVLLGLLASLVAKAQLAAFSGTRTRPGLLAALWFGLFAAWTMLANSIWYPASIFASGSTTLADAIKPYPAIAEISGIALAAMALFMLLAAARKRFRPTVSPLRARSYVAAAAVAVLLGSLPFASTLPSAAPTPSPRPHVVLIGIDSLRCDVTALGGEASLTPNIDEFLAASAVLGDVTSPLARTFPAWISTLTGRHPASTNARFNLMPRAKVAAGDTLADALRDAGYRTIYSTDEVRFANIDESYGFDRLVTPPIGASDFLLGSANDLPLTNLLSATRLGAWLFPHTYANRAAHVTYRPDRYARRLLGSVSFDEPTFLAIHLTLAHWPYSWAGLEKPTTPDAFRASYRHAVKSVDDQFAAIMAGLDQMGVLSNAIVVVFSDHGEALGGPTDTMLRQVGSADQIWSSVWGHGTSVMSPHQFQVLAAVRSFSPTIQTVAGVIDAPATLEDIRPTVLDLLMDSPGGALDGISLAPAILGKPLGAEVADRIRFTETDFNTPSILQGQFDEKGALREGAAYYELVPSSGWVQLKAARLPELIAAKERAAISSTHHLAALPGGADGKHIFFLSQRDNPLPMRLHDRPDPSLEPVAARLWDALHERFPGEL